MRDEIKAGLYLLGLIPCLALSCVPAAQHVEHELRALSAGVAKVKITPATPIPMSGYDSRKEPFKGVHDDIFARVVVLSDGIIKAAIISVDVIGFSHEFWEDLTGRIEGETGVSREAVFLAAVHNHGGPVTMVYDRNPDAEVVSYNEELKSLIIGCVKEAAKDLQPASIGGGKTECLMNINRRAPHPDGSISLGRNPYGPCDHEVGVIRVEKTTGQLLSILVNWPCHATVMGPNNYEITGDWPGSASRYIENTLGGEVVAPVLIGASGDINPIYGPHIDFNEVRWYSYGVDQIGMDLGVKASAVASEIRGSAVGSISFSQQVISLPKKLDDPSFQQPDVQDGDGLSVRLSVLKIGDLVLAGISGELFNQIGVRIRERSPYANTVVVTHCNGSSGYLVTDAAYTVGGYEVTSTQAKSGAEEAIIGTLINMINAL